MLRHNKTRIKLHSLPIYIIHICPSESLLCSPGVLDFNALPRTFQLPRAARSTSEDVELAGDDSE